MKKKLLSLLALVMTVVTASAIDAPSFKLKKAQGAEAHGTIKFYVGENLEDDVTTAKEGELVTVIISPSTGWVVNAPAGEWNAAIAAARNTDDPVEMLKEFSLSYQSTDAQTAAQTWTFTMERADAEISCKYKKLLTHTDITVADIAALTYTGEQLKPAVTVKDGTTVLVKGTDYTVTYSNNKNACPANAETDAPTVTITAVSTSEKYAGETSKTFTINKADITPTAPKAKSGLVYNTNYQSLVDAGIAEGGEMRYSLDGVEYTLPIPTGLDAGEYTVYYKVIGDRNHNDVAPKNFKVSIGKATLTSVKLTKTQFVYNQEEQTPDIASVWAGTIEVPAGDYYGAGSATNVGTYTFTATAFGTSKNFTGSATAQWSIVTAGTLALVITVDPASVVYDGTEQKPAVIVKDGETTLEEDVDYTLVYENNIDAGTATVTLTGKGNYEGTQTSEFTIEKGDITTTAPTAVEGLVYNAGAQTLIEAGQAEGGEMQYSFDGENFSTTLPTGTEAGEYNVFYKVVGDKNHNDTEAMAVMATIAPAELTAAELVETNLVYNQEEQAAQVATVTAGTLTVPADGYEVSGNTGTTVGNYTATITGKGNFTGEVEAQWSIIEANAKIFDVELGTTTYTYDGTEKKPEVTVKDGETTLEEDVDYTLVYENNIDAGTATVTVTGMGNYVGTESVQFTIEKADVTATAPTAVKGLKYDAKAHTLVEAGSTDYGMMQYSLNGNSYSATLPQGTNAGEYDVYYKVAGDKNHKDTEAQTVKVTIEAATLSDVTLAQTELTYNQQEQSVSVGSVKAGALDVKAGEYEVKGNSATEIGTYTVTVTGKGNFKGEVTATFTIKPAGAEALFSVELEYDEAEWTGEGIEPKVTVKDGNTVLKEGVDYTVSYTNNVNVGTATVTVTGMGNYEGAKTATFTIVRTIFNVDAEDVETGESVSGLTIGMKVTDEAGKKARIENLIVPGSAAGEKLAVHVPATVGGYKVTEIASGTIKDQNVTDIYLPDTEEPIDVKEGALPEDGIIHTTLELLDDYAMMPSLKTYYERSRVMTTVTPANKFWTLGTGCDVILPEALTAFTVKAKSETQVSTVKISEDDLAIGGKRVVKANNGVLLLGEAGKSYDLIAYSGRIANGTPIVTTDNKDYGTDNLLQPIVEKIHFNAGDSYFVMKDNEFHAIKAEDASVKVPAGKAVLHLVSTQAGARAQVLGIDAVATGIGSVGCDSVATYGNVFDLQGRRVVKAAKGTFIVDGKVVVVK